MQLLHYNNGQVKEKLDELKNIATKAQIPFQFQPWRVQTTEEHNLILATNRDTIAGYLLY